MPDKNLASDQFGMAAAIAQTAGVLSDAEAYADTKDAITLAASEAYTDAAVAAIPGGGDVVGPASSVDSRIVQFDGTTGKLLKDGGLSSASFDAAGAASTAQTAAIAAAATHSDNASNLSSGTVGAARLDTATTQTAGDNTTKIATTAFVTTAQSNAAVRAMAVSFIGL